MRSHIGKILEFAVAALQPHCRGLQPLLGLLAFGDFLLQFFGPFLNALLQIVPAPLQFGVARLDLCQHFVETVDQFAQFIVAVLDGAQGIIFPLRDLPGCFGQVQDGPGHDPLKAKGEQPGHANGDRQHRGENVEVLLEAVV